MIRGCLKHVIRAQSLGFVARSCGALGALAIWMAAAGCVNAPQPVRQQGWEQHAVSAAGAPMYFDEREPLTQRADRARGASRDTQNAGISPASGRPAPADGSAAPAHASTADDVAEAAFTRKALDERAQLKTLPDANATAEQIAAWLVAAIDARKPDSWIIETLATRSKASDRVALQRADFDGDHKPDLIAAIPEVCDEKGSCPMEPNWTVMVVWADQSWSLLPENYGRQPTFLPATDFTGDGLTDPALTMVTCGAHTCFKNVWIFSTQQKRAPNPASSGEAKSAPAAQRLPALREIFNSFDPTTGLNQEVEVRRDKKPPILLLAGSVAGSIGAGPAQRELWEAWQWQPQAHAFRRGPSTWETSNLRIHRLQDALDALRGNDRKAGVKALKQVIDDSTLKDPGTTFDDAPATQAAMRRQLAQVAHFELARLALADGDQDEYHRILGRLSAKSPDTSVTRATRELGQVFEKTRDAHKACLHAARLIEHADDKGWTLSADSLGYNPSIAIDADTLCPPL